MKQIRTIMGIIFLVFGLSLIFTAKGTQVHQMLQAGITFSCTGFIMIFCGKE